MRFIAPASSYAEFEGNATLFPEEDLMATLKADENG
jgi:hypothetical protein